MYKKLLVACIIIQCITHLVSAQTIREVILNADTIVKGYVVELSPKYKNDYEGIRLGIVLCGTKDTLPLKTVPYPVKLLYSKIDENGTYECHTFLLKGDGFGEYYALDSWYENSKVLELLAKDMLSISKMKDGKEKFKATVDWIITLMESLTPSPGYVNYDDLSGYSSFIGYYRSIGLVTKVDSILSFDQKSRILSKLLTIKEWHTSEFTLAALIYNDYPKEINGYIINVISTRMDDEELSNWDLMNLLKLFNTVYKHPDILKIIVKIENGERMTINYKKLIRRLKKLHNKG